MPYSITWEQKGVYCKFFGKVETAHISDMLREIASDDRFDAIRYWLTDYLDVTQQHIVAADVDEVIALEFAQNFSNSHHYAVAVANDEDILALLHYWKSNHPDHEQIAYFTSLEQAREWIVIQPQLFLQKIGEF